MDSDEVYKFIGYAVAVIFFIYLITKSIKLNVRVIEGMTSSNDSKKNIKDNKVDDEGKDKDNKKTSKKTQENLSNKEKQNEDNKKKILDRKETTKDILSATYNHNLNLIIVHSAALGRNQDFSTSEMPKQEEIDNMNKLKTIKEYLDIVEFAYNQLDEMK